MDKNNQSLEKNLEVSASEEKNVAEEMQEEKKKKIKRTRLSNPAEIRRYMASLIRRVEADELDHGKARILTNLTEALLKAYRTDVLEQKLMDIEEVIAQNSNSIVDDTEFFLKQFK